MLLYSIIMFLVAALFYALGIAIYKGKTDLIHDYHQTKVKDKAAYGKAFGRAMLATATAPLLSGILGLFGNTAPFAAIAVCVLFLGLAIGIFCIAMVQKKYNNGIF